jgi:hypothetical protein
MVPCASPAVAHSPVLRPDWETLAQLASTWSKPLYLNACPTLTHPSVGFVMQPTNWILLNFEAQTKKPLRWFWGSNHQTVAAILKTKPKNPPPPWFWGSTKKPSPPVLMPNQRNSRCRFWGQTGENHRPWFWGQSRENRPNGFEAKPLANRRPWFWGSTKKLVLLVSTCMMQTAHSVTWALDFPAIEYPTCATISDPLHQVSYSFHDPHRCPPYHTCTPWDKQTWFSKRNKDKDKTTKMSWIRIQTSPCQWRITIKPRNWPLDFLEMLKI